MSAGLARRPQPEADAPDTAEAAFLADWLAAWFIAPPDASAVAQLRGPSATALLSHFGQILDCEDVIATLAEALGRGDAEAAARHLSHRHVTLFDGPAGPETIPLCESAYRGDGLLFQEPFAEMQSLLRVLDLSLGAGIVEPADHVSIELSSLAEALSNGEEMLAIALRDRLRGWVPDLAARLHAADAAGFHAAAAALLAHYLAKLPAILSRRQEA